MSTIIQPAPGRIVWYTPADADTGLGHFNREPLAAIVVCVHSARLVNLTVFDANGQVHQRPSTQLLQENDDVAIGAAFASWMPFQLAQAKRQEEPANAQNEATAPEKTIETKTYPDGTVATGVAPLPEQSPAANAQDEAPADANKEVEGDIVDAEIDAGRDISALRADNVTAA